MQRFEVQTPRVRQVTWQAAYWPWTLRRTHGRDPREIELHHDDVRMAMSVRELLLLREAIDVLLPPEWEDEDEHFGGHRHDPELPWSPAPAPAPAPPRVVTPKPANNGKPWAPEDEARLVEGHGRGESVKELAAALERTPSGVEARLVKLGLVAPKPNGWRGVQGPAPSVEAAPSAPEEEPLDEVPEG